jgi:hypothetical protein
MLTFRIVLNIYYPGIPFTSKILHKNHPKIILYKNLNMYLFKLDFITDITKNIQRFDFWLLIYFENLTYF